MHVADDIKWRLIPLGQDAKLAQQHVTQPNVRVRSLMLIHARYLTSLSPGRIPAISGQDRSPLSPAAADARTFILRPLAGNSTKRTPITPFGHPPTAYTDQH